MSGMRVHFARVPRAGVVGSLLLLGAAALVGCSASSSSDDSSAGSGGLSSAGAGAQSAAGATSGGSTAGGQNSAGALGSTGTAGTSTSSGGNPGRGGSTGSGGTPGAAGAGGGSSAGTSNGGSAGKGGAGNAGSGGMPAATCPMACGANSKCEAATLTCVCSPGFVTVNGACAAAPVGDPSTHTQDDVCTRWKAGHVITETKPLTASGSECDAGTLKPGGITDTLVRINMFRYLEGLGPVTDDPTYDANAQLCANLESWWDFSSTVSAHAPPSTSKCYTKAGGDTAGQSNIAWGSNGPAQSIDQYMQDNGNETTLGHRRWIVNPPLNPIGIGYWEKGGMYNNASCLRVFASTGTGPKPSWNAVPPAGFAPIEMAKYAQWSFEGSIAGIPTATATVLSVEDNQQLAVTMQTLSQGYGQNTMSFKHDWVPEVGKTYRVTVTGLTGGNVVYDVKPVMCN